MTAVRNHPAKFSVGVLTAISSRLPNHEDYRILDPFAGIGGIFDLHLIGFRGSIVGVEIEPEWASNNPAIIVGNALSLDFPDEYFDAIVTSPVYGNRMSDHHDAKDDSKRNTYRHTLGRELHPDNSGRLQWGEKYREFHKRAWAESVRVLKPGGMFLLNIKDHIRNNKRQEVSLWHQSCLTDLGLSSLGVDKVLAAGNGFGQNGRSRVPYEYVMRFRKG